MTEPLATIEQLAFREGGPEDWGGGEFVGWEANYVITKRICDGLGIQQITPAIRAAAIAESNRQQKLVEAWNREQAIIDRERAYRASVADKVTGLAAAIERFVATGNRDLLEEDLYDAFRPETRRQQHQADYVESFFRPIG
jgi:hypothetical protein